MYQQKYMKQAIAIAAENVVGEAGGPFGCVIVKDDQVVAAAHNTVLASHDATAHGEVNAIRQAGAVLGTHDLTGCVLYTNAMPCPMCLGAIMWANIHTVYYGNAAADAAAIGFRDDDMYHFIAAGMQGSQLTLEQHDRDLTIQTFSAYQAAAKKIY